MANLGALSVLASPRDLYLVDEGAHSCMWDGIRLSGARKLIYQHQNYQDLTSKLIKNYDKYDSIFIVTESVFSMYGSKCKLDILEKLTYDYPKLIIYLDEAHATGIYGASGAGRSTELSSKENFIIMGTLSKALASEGGYICGSKILIEYLKNTARTFIYSTASSPQICQQSINHINFVKQASQLRDQLKNNIKYFKEQLQAYKISFTNEDSAIFMLPAPDSKQALALEKYFKEQQILVTTILPPTVKQASLRICLSAQHSIAEIDLFCKIFLSFNS
jgi:7-keto-8-aminopelargonate synthetase-like enzyme